MYLIIDFDKTYFRNDFFQDQLKLEFTRNPVKIVKILCLSKSWIGFKNYILKSVKIEDFEFGDVVNSSLDTWIRDNSQRFKGVSLVSASPDNFIKSVSRRFEGEIFPFSEVFGSTSINLKGENKLAFIKKHYGTDFWYVGDSRSDNIIFAAARGAIKVSSGKLKVIKGDII